MRRPPDENGYETFAHIGAFVLIGSSSTGSGLWDCLDLARSTLAWSLPLRCWGYNKNRRLCGSLWRLSSNFCILSRSLMVLVCTHGEELRDWRLAGIDEAERLQVS